MHSKVSLPNVIDGVTGSVSIVHMWISHYNRLLLSAFTHQGSPQRIFHFQLLITSVSSSVTSTSAISSFTTSINLLFGLYRFLFPGNSVLSILLPIYPSSFLSTCPYHLSLASRVFSPNRPIYLIVSRKTIIYVMICIITCVMKQT